MTKKDSPELTVNLKTTLQKFGGFLKVLAFVLGALGVGIGGPAVSRTIFPTEYEEDLRVRDSIINVLQEEVATHDKSIDKLNYRMDTNDENLLAIRASLTRIENFLIYKNNIN